MSLIAKAREFFRPGGLACPRCEKPIEGHDEKACERRMSRRYFFGALAAGVAAVALPKALPKPRRDEALRLQAMEEFGRLYPDPVSGVEIAEVVGRWNAETVEALNNCLVRGTGFFRVVPRQPEAFDGYAKFPWSAGNPKNLADAIESAAGPILMTHGWSDPMDPRDLRPGAVFTMDVSYIENTPSRARRCPAYN